MKTGADTGFEVREVYECHFRAGEIVFDEGQDADALYVIQSGQVELSRRGDGEARAVSRFGPGDFFGEMGVLLGRPRSSRAVAVGEASLLRLDRGTFEAMCLDRPEIALRVIQRLATRSIELEQRLAALGVDDLLRPIVRVLMRQATASGRVDTTLRKLAGDTGLGMLEAYRGLTQLLERKLVRVVDDALEIADREALAAALDPSE